MSQKTYQLSLPSAILININIMLGSGIFINTAILANKAGIFGSLSYLIIGLLMFPLVASVAKLVNIHPSGGFYTYGQKELSPIAGFWSAWGYFTGKLAAAMLVIHIAVSLAQQLFPITQTISTFFLDFCVLSLFIALNMKNIKTGSFIQGIFMCLKSVPIFFAILGGLFLICGDYNATISYDYLWQGIPFTLPLVIYAMSGFEAACSLSSQIKDSEKNAPRAIFISYAITIIIAFLYQTIFYGALGSTLASLPDYRYVFPALLQSLLPSYTALQHTGTIFLHIGIIASVLGSGYSILFSNAWNLYTLAQHNHVFFAARFTKFNKHLIPWLCILTEGIICILYLLISKGNQVPLQQISALGNITAYTISTLALLKASWSLPAKYGNYWLPFLGSINCALLITACVYNLVLNGTNSFIVFCTLLVFGTLMFFVQKYRHQPSAT